jgi:hypothetical protein
MGFVVCCCVMRWDGITVNAWLSDVDASEIVMQLGIISKKIYFNKVARHITFTRHAVAVPAATRSAASRSPSRRRHSSRRLLESLTIQSVMSPNKAPAQEHKRKHV